MILITDSCLELRGAISNNVGIACICVFNTPEYIFRTKKKTKQTVQDTYEVYIVTKLSFDQKTFSFELTAEVHSFPCFKYRKQKH